MNKYSGIEHLIFDHWINVNQLDTWLSYVPHLRSLSANLVEDHEQMDANNWQQLIRLYLTKLRIFNEFLTKSNGYPAYMILFSTNPYRRKDYILYKRLERIIVIDNEQITISSVSHIYIKNGKEMNRCMCYFPRVITLTFDYGFSINAHLSIAMSLTRILSLKQLKTLIIQCVDLPFIQMIKISSKK
ncbi:hypothetical protein I4U23_016764 [Adineta vaga]|nr:hypothetical protein I4U23_016764 [Adineta vaga]